jgi:hypothetical protein
MHDPGFCIQYTEGRTHNEKSVVLGNNCCWSRGGLHDVSSWRVTRCDCSAHGDQPSGVVGHGIENGFQLSLVLRGRRHLPVNLLPYELVLV